MQWWHADLCRLSFACRRLAQDLSYPLITLLQQECTRTTCPEMKAGEWQYLCVAHGTDGAMEVSTLFVVTGQKSDPEIHIT